MTNKFFEKISITHEFGEISIIARSLWKQFTDNWSEDVGLTRNWLIDWFFMIVKVNKKKRRFVVR